MADENIAYERGKEKRNDELMIAKETEERRARTELAEKMGQLKSERETERVHSERIERKEDKKRKDKKKINEGGKEVR